MIPTTTTKPANYEFNGPRLEDCEDFAAWQQELNEYYDRIDHERTNGTGQTALYGSQGEFYGSGLFSGPERIQGTNETMDTVSDKDDGGRK